MWSPSCVALRRFPAVVRHCHNHQSTHLYVRKKIEKKIELLVYLLLLMVKLWWFELLPNGLIVVFVWWLSFDFLILTFDVCFGFLKEDWEYWCWSKTSRSYAPWSHLYFNFFLYFCFGRCISGIFSYILVFLMIDLESYFYWSECGGDTGRSFKGLVVGWRLLGVMRIGRTISLVCFLN